MSSNVRTMNPFYVDINLMSSTDLLQKVTDYTDLLINNPTYTGINSIYWHTYSHSDPVTSKINFYKDLHDGTLTVKDNPDGVKKNNVIDKDVINKNLRDQLPPHIHVKTSDSSKYGDPVMKSDTEMSGEIRNRVKTWVATIDNPVISTPGKWKIQQKVTDVTFAVDPLPDSNLEPVEYKPTSGLKDMSPWEIMCWLDRLNTCHKIVKDTLLETLGSSNEYYVKFSESIGQLKNPEYLWNTSTIPVYDWEKMRAEKSIARILPGIAEYNLTKEAKALSQRMSDRTNTLYRKNMCNMVEQADKDKPQDGPVFFGSFIQNHGSTLIADDMHPGRMTGLVGDILDILQEHLKGLYPVLQMLSLKENYMSTGKPKVILTKIEKTTQAIDRLKRKVFAHPSGAYTLEELTPPKYFGDSAKYTGRLTTADYLE